MAQQSVVLINDKERDIYGNNNHFKWLNKFILLFPLFSTILPPEKHNHIYTKKRSKYLITIGVAFSLLLITADIVCRFWYFLEIFNFLNQNHDNDISYDIYNIISNIFLSIGRCIMFYYFIKHFDFPWYDSIFQNNKSIHHQKIIKAT
eukprot:338738_1